MGKWRSASEELLAKTGDESLCCGDVISDQVEALSGLTFADVAFEELPLDLWDGVVEHFGRCGAGRRDRDDAWCLHD